MQPILIAFISVTIFIGAISIEPCGCSSINERFERRQGQKVDLGFKQIDGTSAAGCAAECGNDIMCVAVSYQPVADVCLLNEYHPDDDLIKDTVTNENGWAVYVKVSESCPGDWIFYNRSCYLFVKEETQWLDAETKCQNHGGHLVTIETQAENEFVSDHVESSMNYWIGLNDIASEGTYVWVSDGSQAGLTFWADKQPNNYDSLQHCVVINHLPDKPSLWNDQYCDLQVYFACEM